MINKSFLKICICFFRWCQSWRVFTIWWKGGGCTQGPPTPKFFLGGTLYFPSQSPPPKKGGTLCTWHRLVKSPSGRPPEAFLGTRGGMGNSFKTAAGIRLHREIVRKIDSSIWTPGQMQLPISNLRNALQRLTGLIQASYLSVIPGLQGAETHSL